MKRKISMLSHLPEFYTKIREFVQLADTNDVELKELHKQNEIDILDSFIMTASEKSISIWENEIGVRADSVVDSIDFRRKRLINRYTTKPPFTIRWLENQLVDLLGDAFICCKRDDDIEILYVYIQLLSLPLLREFDSSIEAVLPLSMQYQKILKSDSQCMQNIYAGMAGIIHIHLQAKQQ